MIEECCDLESSDEEIRAIMEEEMEAIGQEGKMPPFSLYFLEDPDERGYYRASYNCALDRLHRRMLTR